MFSRFTLSEASEVLAAMRKSPRRGNQLRLEKLAAQRPIKTLLDAYAVVFANPAAIKRAEHLPKGEYDHLVRVVAYIDPRVLQYAVLDKEVERWIENVPGLKIENVSFDGVSEELYTRLAEKLCTQAWSCRGISPKLSAANYNKVAEAVLTVSPRAIKTCDPERIEYSAMARKVIEIEPINIRHINAEFVDDYEGLLRLAARLKPTMLHYCADKFRQLPDYDDLLVEYIGRAGELIAQMDNETARRHAEEVVTRTPWAIYDLNLHTFTREEYTRLAKLAIKTKADAVSWVHYDHLTDDAYAEITVAALKESSSAVLKLDYNRFPVREYKELLFHAFERTPAGLARLSYYSVDAALLIQAAFSTIKKCKSKLQEVILDINWRSALHEKRKELYLLAARRDGALIEHFCHEYCDAAIYEAAVMSNGMAILFIPVEHITQELIELSIKENPAMLGAFTASEIGPNYAAIATEACRRGNSSPPDGPDRGYNSRHSLENPMISMVDPAGMSSDEYEKLCTAAVAAERFNIKYVQYPLCRAEMYGALLF